MDSPSHTIEPTQIPNQTNTNPWPHPISPSSDSDSDSEFCFDDPIDDDEDSLSQSGSVTKLQPRSVVIKACWKDKICMSEVVHHKGRLLISIGIVRSGKIYLSIEETLYLAEIGALIPVDDVVTTLPLQDLYEKVAEGKGGCSWEHFEVYRYLKSLGYIVGRHGIPWSLKSAKSCTTVLEGAAVDKDESTLNALDGSTIAQMLNNLHIKEVKPFFVVYLPNTKFKKTSPGDPIFAVLLARHRPPSRSDIEEIKRQCNGTKLKVVHVDHGRVSFFSFDQVELPALP